MTLYETGSYKNFHKKSEKLNIEKQVKICPPMGRIDTAHRYPENTARPLQFSCAQQFLANTIYGILPNFPRQTFMIVSGVKIGLLQELFFNIVKLVFAVNQYNFRLSQKLAKYQTFLKFSDYYCR
jgi:hypothetical protein